MSKFSSNSIRNFVKLNCGSLKNVLWVALNWSNIVFPGPCHPLRFSYCLFFLEGEHLRWGLVVFLCSVFCNFLHPSLGCSLTTGTIQKLSNFDKNTDFAQLFFWEHVMWGKIEQFFMETFFQNLQQFKLSEKYELNGYITF